MIDSSSYCTTSAEIDRLESIPAGWSVAFERRSGNGPAFVRPGPGPAVRPLAARRQRGGAPAMGETIAQNRRARHDYSIEDTFEAGIVLRGTEIKSVRAHKVSLADAYARIDRDEAWIVGLHIAPWESADVRFNHEPKRARKLLLHRHEIDELLGKTKAKGLTLVPLRIYINDSGQGEAGAGARPGQADLGPAARDRRAGREAGHGPPGRRRAAALGTGRRRPMRLARMLQAVDAHAAGEPGRVIVGGVLDVPGRHDAREDAPPRGARRLAAAADAPRAARLPRPVRQRDPAADPPGGPGGLRDHGARRVPRACRAPTRSAWSPTLLETGMLPMTEPVTELVLEAPAGLIRVRATCAGGKVTGVTFRNVPAFATHLDAPIEVPGLGTVTVDVAYGGMFYVIADAEALGLPAPARRGSRHHPGHAPDHGGGRRAAPRRPPGAARRSPGITIGQLSGPGPRPARTRGATW